TIDGGLLLAAHRQAQNAADAAALAAARDKLAGRSDSTALATANTYIQQYNGLSGAPDLVAGQTFNIPPKQGAYAGKTQYIEVIVTSPVRTFFVHILGGSQSRTATGRAVAGIQAVSSNLSSAVLDPNARPGLSLSGGGKLIVNGGVVVNSQAAGSDQDRNWIALGIPPYAVTTGNNSTVQAGNLQVVGGVDPPANITSLPGSSGSPLHAGALSVPDPLLNLPTPTTSNGVVNTYPGLNSRGQWQTYNTPQDVSVSISGNQSITFSPGIYNSIAIAGGGPGTVTFSPGIYVLVGGKSVTLNITTGATVTGNGVMFYNTGSDYS